MLTIGKLGTTRGRLEYYDSQVAAGIEDYYAGRGESPGRWRGSGIEALGLTPGGRVERSGFMALMRGLSPADGSVLRLIGARSTVSGFDLAFSAPKSVSVLFAIDDERVAGELLAAHERAVDDALAYLEQEACWTRRGHDGVERLQGQGFIAASYRHRMSRAGDPQLHTHVVVANMTLADGRYTALDGHSLYEHKSAAGVVYRAVLRAEVRRRLPWLSWRPVGRGLFELEGVPESVLRHFSQRRVEIEERALELVGVGAAEELSRERMQGIALATRKAKSYGVDGGTWREQARARAAEHGLGSDELASLRTRGARDDHSPDLAALTERLSGRDGLTERHNTFARRHALAEIAGAFGQGVTISQLEGATSSYLDDGTVARLSGPEGEPRYTTQGLLACEREIIEGAERRRSENMGVIPAALVDRVLAECVPVLNDDQAAAVRAITSSGRGAEAVSALAGTGKTTMIATLATAYRHAGWRVIGTAPTARAARQLREVAGIETGTMHSLLASLRGPGRLDARTVLVLDEAGMAPTRRSAQLLGYAELAGVKVIAVGDPGQLGSVEAGGWLPALIRCQQGPALRQVMRQQDQQEQRALEALHHGDPSHYLTHKQDQITVHDTEVDGVRQLSQAWHAAQLEHGQHAAVMIARDNVTRERLNRAARAILKHHGLLHPHGVIIGGREYAAGDRVITRRNDRRNDIDNGSLATIIAVDDKSSSIILETDSGQPRALEPDYIAQHVEHAYALTAHGAQGATVNWTGVIGRPQDFTREWAYTALSRARHETTIYLVSEPSERQRERDEYAPSEPHPAPHESLRELERSMRRSEREPLATDQAPVRPLQSEQTEAAPAVPISRTSEPSGVALLRQRQLPRGARRLAL